MFAWTLKHIILSTLFIWLIHKIYNYFKLQLTVPKVKDLVNKPIYEYENMFKTTKTYKLYKTIKQLLKPIKL